MTWTMIGWNVALGLLLFLISLALGRLQGKFVGLFAYQSFTFQSNAGQSFSGNFFQRIITPTIVLAIICAVIQALGHSAVIGQLWLTVPAYWLIRTAVLLLENRLKYINCRYEAFAIAASLALSEGVLFGLILPLVTRGEPVLIELTEFRDAFWFAAIAYAAKLCWDIAKGFYTGERLYSDEKRRNILESRYLHFLRKYGADIDALLADRCAFVPPEKKAHLRQLVYAIMIYEDYNRPFVKRLAEYTVFSLGLRKEMTLGIMQVRTNYKISSLHSILLAVDKLKIWFYGDQDAYECVNQAIWDYNDSLPYHEEVMGIYEFLLEWNVVPCG